MRVIDASQTAILNIGYAGEKDRTLVKFPIADIQAEFPGGSVIIQVRRPGEGTKHDILPTVEDGNAYWTVGDYDLAYRGQGECQLVYSTSDQIAKRKVWKTLIDRSIEGSNESIPPDWEDIEASLLNAAGAVAEAVASYDEMTAEAETLPEGSQATAEMDHSGDAPVLKLGIPKGDTGHPGQDGVSPTVTVTDITGGHRITVTDANGSRHFDVMDGEDGEPGQPGQDGVSPTLTVTNITGGHRITITDKNGTQTVDVMNGEKGDPGQDADPTTLIDDTAGEGDVTKVLSADKIAREFSALNNEIKSKANGNIIDKNNILETAQIIYDQYYYGSYSASDTYDTYIISITSGTEYTFSGIRFLSTESAGIDGYNASTVHTYTATYSGLLYVSVSKPLKQQAFFCTTVNYSAEDYGTIGTPLFSSTTLAQTSGQSTKKPASQKLVSDLIDETEESIDTKISNLLPIMPESINGISMVNGSDLLTLSEEKTNGYYYSYNNTLTWAADSSYKAYKIKATPGYYNFSCKSRFTVVTDENDNVLSYLSSNSENVTCPEDTAFLYVSFNSAYWSICKVCRGDYTPIPLAYSWDTLKVNLGELNNKLYGKGFEEVKDSLSNGETLTIHGTNVKKNQVYSFLAYITSFDTLLIGHGKNNYDGSWIEINATKMILHRYLNSDTTTEYSHGLTIADYIYVEITVGVNVATVSIFSGGTTYTEQNIQWTGDGEGNTFAESVNSTLTNCTFTWSCADFRKSVWMFGDSYFGMTNGHRWVKYLMDAGYGDNVMLNGFPGEDSSQAVPSLENAISYYGKPRFIIWCLGMNDGSDTNASTPTSKWLNGINTLLGVCNEHGIIPILATIPSVPSISHEGKNAYVKSSGYRYIDFAKAVGAQSNGTWFSGMLYEDNVHPDTAGAIALYYQAIADAPEITYSNP